MLNNKGQSLVLFILIIPILLGIMALVIDVGNVWVKKNEIDNVIELVLNYGLDSNRSSENDEQLVISNEALETKLDNNLEIREEELEVLLTYNLENVQNKVLVDKEKITIVSETYVEGIFSRILGFEGFFIASEYYGYVEDGQKKILKIK